MSQQSNLPNKILVVDDDPSVAQVLEEALQRHQVKLDKATNLETAFYLFNQQKYDVVLVEIEFGPLPGLALVQKWRQHDVPDRQATAFIMLSGNKTLGNNEGLIKELGDLEVLNKPFGVVQLLPFLSRGLATKKRLLSYQDLKANVLNYYEKTGNFDKAAEQVQKRVADLGPKGTHILYELYEKAGRWDDALKIVDKLLESDANNIALLNAKGRHLMRLGRFDEAKNVLLKSDELAPQNIERINEIASAYLHLKDPQNSVARFKQIMDMSPELPDLKFEMFSKLYDHGFDDHAVQFGKECAKPMEIVRHYNNKGVMMSKEGQSEKAVSEYQRALKFFPKFKENFRILYNIALAHAQQKTPEGYAEAQLFLKKCLELSPEFEKAQKMLEQVEQILQKSKPNRAS